MTISLAGWTSRHVKSICEKQQVSENFDLNFRFLGKGRVQTFARLSRRDLADRGTPRQGSPNYVSQHSTRRLKMSRVKYDFKLRPQRRIEKLELTTIAVLRLEDVGVTYLRADSILEHIFISVKKSFLLSK